MSKAHKHTTTVAAKTKIEFLQKTNTIGKKIYRDPLGLLSVKSIQKNFTLVQHNKTKRREVCEARTIYPVRICPSRISHGSVPHQKQA